MDLKASPLGLQCFPSLHNEACASHGAITLFPKRYPTNQSRSLTSFSFIFFLVERGNMKKIE